MKKKMNRVTSILLAGTMAAALTACGGGNSTPETTTQGNAASQETAAGETAGETTASVGGQTLKVLLSEEPGAGDALGSSLNAWAEETGNKIETIIISHDDQRSKFPAMAKNKDLPDLISTTFLHQIYPDEFLDMSTVLDLSGFNERALKIVGKSYSSDMITGVPEQFTITCMYYNKDLFEAAGIEVPTPENPWTWDELYKNAEAIQEKTDVKYGFAADVSRARYDILMYANGGSMVEEDGDSYKVTINSEQNASTLERFVQANDDGVMPKAIWAGGTTDNPVEYFKNGDAAILLSGSWNYNTFAEEISKFEFEVMPTPKGSEGQSSIIGGAALVIPTNGKNADLAKEYINWLYQDENYQEYLQKHKGLSVKNDLMYEPDTDKAKADFAMMQNELNYVTDTFMVDENSSWRNYKDNEYRDNLKRAVAGEVTPQEALDSFAKQLSEASGWSMIE